MYIYIYICIIMNSNASDGPWLTLFWSHPYSSKKVVTMTQKTPSRIIISSPGFEETSTSLEGAKGTANMRTFFFSKYTPLYIYMYI